MQFVLTYKKVWEVVASEEQIFTDTKGASQFDTRSKSSTKGESTGQSGDALAIARDALAIIGLMFEDQLWLEVATAGSARELWHQFEEKGSALTAISMSTTRHQADKRERLLKVLC